MMTMARSMNDYLSDHGGVPLIIAFAVLIVWMLIKDNR